MCQNEIYGLATEPILPVGPTINGERKGQILRSPTVNRSQKSHKPFKVAKAETSTGQEWLVNHYFDSCDRFTSLRVAILDTDALREASFFERVAMQVAEHTGVVVVARPSRMPEEVRMNEGSERAKSKRVNECNMLTCWSTTDW